MLSNLEHAEELVLQGWAMLKEAPAATVSVDIHINGRFTARIPACTYRGDLDAFYGSGHHAFFFNPIDYLDARQNLIEVREASSNALLAGGARWVTAELTTDRETYRQARARAQSRWLGPRPDPENSAAEWTFLERLELAAHFHPALRILEVGCGEGHLLSLLIHRRKPFSSYLGLDLSRANIEAIFKRFTSDRIRLMTGDAARYPFTGQFDLVIASSLCDALFPSFLPLLQNIRRALSPGGLAAFDLVVEDDRNSMSRAEWRGDRWLRLYSQQEIGRLLTEAGLELLGMQIYAKTASEHRVFITALKRHVRPRNIFENR